MLSLLRVVARVVFVVVIVAALGVGGVVGVTLMRFSRDLPNVKELVDYVPATGTKVYAGDGSFMAEFDTQYRIPVSIDQVPPLVIHAFLAAEDRDFYHHNGINLMSILRAGFADLLRLPRGQRPLGASTITQQVVRHFLLNDKLSIVRKIKEALLAYRIEQTLSKNRILDIYLNEIYLGAGAYGVAAAAETYFQKPLDQLTIAEAAFLAALPKAPNNYNPIRHPRAAKARRDWVINGMAEVGWITEAQAAAAVAQPLDAVPHNETAGSDGHDSYFLAEVRRELIGRFGEKMVYEGGLTVRTSYVPVYQKMAETAFRNGLVRYDRRHGWRGPIKHLASAAAAEAMLGRLVTPPAPASWQLAAVTAIDRAGATIALKSGGTGFLPLSKLRWARRTVADQKLGPPVRRVSEVVVPGDIVLVEPVAARAEHRHGASLPIYGLRQIPNVGGGMVVSDPHTGRVFAVVGGWSFKDSQFDRAIQARRQPGSAFKPFVYVTALEKGFSPDSIVDDAPISIPQGPGLPDWQPVNYEGTYVGPTTLADGLIHSRNLVTARLATMIGLPSIARTVEAFDVMDKMPLYYSMTLGAGETTLLRLTNAYGMIDNGGHWLLPSVIDLVQDRHGDILYQKGAGGCAACFVAGGKRNGSDASALYRAAGPADPSTIYLPNAHYVKGALLYKPTKHEPLVTPTADWELVQMMQGVVQHGTATVVKAVGKPLAGKTGTTSDWFDAWFVGFSPDIAAGVYVGFDEPRTLGRGEAGGRVAAPIFRDFMEAALAGKPATPFPVPPGAVVASTGPTDGTAAGADIDADGAGGPNADAGPPFWQDVPPTDYPNAPPAAAADAGNPGAGAPATGGGAPATGGGAPGPTASYAPWGPNYLAPGEAPGGYGPPGAGPPGAGPPGAGPADYGPPPYGPPPYGPPPYPRPDWAAQPGGGTGGLY